VEYEILWDGDPEDVLVTTSGNASVDDLHSWVREGMADPRFRQDLKVIVDHTNMRWWALSNDEIERRAGLIRADAESVGRQRVAFVVGSPVDYGLTQMLRSLIATASLIQLEVFDTMVAARDWLRNTDAAGAV
jgi:hypothetical protein